MTYTLFGLGVGPTAVGLISDRLPHTPGALGQAVVFVELAIVAFILPVAFLARHRFHSRMLNLGESH